MIKIRLKRLGVRNHPYYRIVAIDERKKGSGMPLEILGQWFPEKKSKNIRKEAIDKWVKKGAQLSAAVKKLIENK